MPKKLLKDFKEFLAWWGYNEISKFYTTKQLTF